MDLQEGLPLPHPATTSNTRNDMEVKKMKYKYKATNLIANEMDNQGVRYRVFTGARAEDIDCSFPVDEGPIVHVRMISTDDDMDVAVRVFSLINDIPKAKQDRILRVCNELNNKYRYAKFVLDDDDLNVEYDIPMAASEECIGKCACEVFRRLMGIFDSSWPVLMKALFGGDEAPADEPEETEENPVLGKIRRALAHEGVQLSGDESPTDLLRKLRELHELRDGKTEQAGDGEDDEIDVEEDEDE